MTSLINVRGCNGSGKTTLLRSLARHPNCCTVPIHQPFHPPVEGPPPAGDADPETREKYRKAARKAGQPKGRPIVATVTPDGLAMVGDYTRNAAGTTAGLDRIATQADAKAAILAARELEGVHAVLFEGVVVSTIFGPWLDFSRENGGMIWAFLDTPVLVCLERVQMRNGGKPIKEDLVRGKWRSIQRVQEKAKAAGEEVAVLDWEQPLKQMRALIAQAVNRAENGEPGK